jgi:hypothetical protein
MSMFDVFSLEIDDIIHQLCQVSLLSKNKIPTNWQSGATEKQFSVRFHEFLNVLLRFK